MLFFHIISLIVKSRFLLHEITKKFIYIILTKRKNICIICVCIAHQGALLCCFAHNFLIANSQLLLLGIAQDFIYAILTIRNNNHINFVYIAHQGALLCRGTHNFSDNQILSSTAWNLTKINICLNYFNFYREIQKKVL